MLDNLNAQREQVIQTTTRNRFTDILQFSRLCIVCNVDSTYLTYILYIHTYFTYIGTYILHIHMYIYTHSCDQLFHSPALC